MKVKYELPAFIFGIFFLLIFFNPSAAKAQYDDVSLESFYDELSPYGVWIDDPQYGRVWRPDVDQEDFRPYYSRGHWEMTKYGNTWVSDYDWGWAPFHYGRWNHSPRRGWVWIPDTQWGPAWVSWRSGGGNYGWAPLGPGINININIGRIPDFWWVFVPQRQIYYPSYPRYDRRRNMNIYNNTVIINNTYVYNRNRYYAGPRADDIRRITRQPVTVHDVRNQRPNYANGRSNRPEVIRNDGRSGSNVQNPRPQRPTETGRGATNGRSDNAINSRPNDNSNGRGATNGRPDNYVADRPNAGGRESVNSRSGNTSSDRPAERVESRPGEQRIPANTQRSSRSYDNQDVRTREQSQRQRPEITDRQSQSQQQRQQAPQQREARAERPVQQREARAENNRQPRAEQGQNRGGSSERTADRSSQSGGRPARVQ